MWLVFSVITALAWGGANLFYKKGSQVEDKTSHLKIVIMVGFAMGIHATLYGLVKGVDFELFDMIIYLPVSSMYIISMTIGYIGLRYIELSIAAPVQNSSGAISAILLFIFFPRDVSLITIIGVLGVSYGVIRLAMLEKEEELIALKYTEGEVDKKYQIGVLAITFPILYAIIDGIGTFLDGVYLDELKIIPEDRALLAYEFTFFLIAIIAYVYIKFIKKESFYIFKERDRGSAAILETTGQFFYVFAMAGNAMIAAPIIAAHGIFSVLLSRIFLREILTKKQYIIILLVMLGIILLGISDEM